MKQLFLTLSLAVLSQPQNEHPLIGDQRLGLLHRLPDRRAALANAECTDPELVPRSAGTAQLLLAAVLLLISLARRFEIDAEQGRAKQGEDDRGSDGAEDICDRISDGHAVEDFLGLFRRQPEPVDGVGRQTH